jgi:hypothetical protein
MARTLRRPMFRIGGMAHEQRTGYMGGGMSGIMSGITPRQPDAGLTPRVGYGLGDFVKKYNPFKSTPKLTGGSPNVPALYKPPLENRVGSFLSRNAKKLYNLIPEEGIGTILARNFPKTAAAGTAAATMAAPFVLPAGIAASEYPVYPAGHPKAGEYLPREEAVRVMETAGQAGTAADMAGEAAMFDDEIVTDTMDTYGNTVYPTKLNYKKPEIVKVANEELGLGEKDESNKTKKKIVKEEKELQKKSDIESIYGDLLPMIERELGSDPEDTKKQLYVQLAQAGANLLAQPGGDLVGAIGKAAKDPISNVGKVLEKESATDREAKLLAFKLASDKASPGETGKLIQDLKNEGYSSDQISKIIAQRQPGAGYRASADLAELGSLQAELNDEFQKATKGKDVPLNTARDLKIAMDSFGMGASDFKVLPAKEKRVPGQYYFDPTKRKIGRLSDDGKKLIRPNEPGFMDEPEQE